jgi:modulator of FtsH protease HflK
MAWNDSGGPNNNNGGSGSDDRQRGRNPWGKRPQQGPPDLDQWLRNFQRQLASLFGGGRGSRQGDSSGGGSGAGISMVLIALVVVWLATGFYMVDPAERAVVLRFGQFHSVQGPGPHVRLPWPIDTKRIVNIERIESYADQTRMLTADKNMVDINLDVQFRRADPQKFAFKVLNPEATLGEVSESAIRETVGRTLLEDVLEKGRQQVAATTKDVIQKTLDFYGTGIEVVAVNLQDVRVPEQVAPDQQDAIKAGNEKQRSTSLGKTYENDILPKAEGTAARLIQDAQGYRARKIADAEGEAARFSKLLAEYERAPAVTRQRLYLETVESVLGGSKKVVLDTKGAGNMLYLPIDKLMEQRSAPHETVSEPVVVTRPPQTATQDSDRTCNSISTQRHRGVELQARSALSDTFLR